MTEFTMEEAFDRMLDRLTESAIEAHDLRERAGDREGRLRELEKELRNATDELVGARAGIAAVKIEHDNQAPALAEFYAAAEAVLDCLRGNRGPDEVAPSAEQIDRLSKAMMHARQYCDPIPF